MKRQVFEVQDTAGDAHMVATTSATAARRHVARKIMGRFGAKPATIERIEAARQVGIDVETPEHFGDRLARWVSWGLGAVFVLMLLELLARAFGFNV